MMSNDRGRAKMKHHIIYAEWIADGNKNTEQHLQTLRSITENPQQLTA